MTLLTAFLNPISNPPDVISSMCSFSHPSTPTPTHPQANSGAELDLLQFQLEATRKENAALRARLHATTGALAALGSPSLPVLERLAKAAGKSATRLLVLSAADAWLMMMLTLRRRCEPKPACACVASVFKHAVLSCSCVSRQAALAVCA
jgi:hypothetical protein